MESDHDFTEYDQFLAIRSGEVTTPDIAMEAPLLAEQRDFLEHIPLDRRAGVDDLPDCSGAS